MSAQRKVRAQAIVILGFAVSAVSGVFSYFENVTSQGYTFASLRQVVLPMLNPLLLISAVFAWWWLVRVDPRDEGQRVNLHRAYVAFALQYVFTTGLVLLLVTPIRSLGNLWVTSALWLQLVGAAVSALGLFLVSRTLARVSFDAPDADPAIAH